MPRPAGSKWSSRAFKRKPRPRRPKRTLCEELTGMTSEELTEQQRRLKADFLKRQQRH